MGSEGIELLPPSSYEHACGCISGTQVSGQAIGTQPTNHRSKQSVRNRPGWRQAGKSTRSPRNSSHAIPTPPHCIQSPVKAALPFLPEHRRDDVLERSVLSFAATGGLSSRLDIPDARLQAAAARLNTQLQWTVIAIHALVDPKYHNYA
jgi:hypothetical protein